MWQSLSKHRPGHCPMRCPGTGSHIHTYLPANFLYRSVCRSRLKVNDVVNCLPYCLNGANNYHRWRSVRFDLSRRSRGLFVEMLVRFPRKNPKVYTWGLAKRWLGDSTVIHVVQMTGFLCAAFANVFNFSPIDGNWIRRTAATLQQIMFSIQSDIVVAIYSSRFSLHGFLFFFCL